MVFFQTGRGDGSAQYKSVEALLSFYIFWNLRETMGGILIQSKKITQIVSILNIDICLFVIYRACFGRKQNANKKSLFEIETLFLNSMLTSHVSRLVPIVINIFGLKVTAM